MNVLLIIALASLPFFGPTADHFLREAEVVKVEQLDVGTTNPQRLTLSLDGVTARGLWKTVDEPGPTHHDWWYHEVLAYELSEMMGLGLVPATVERVINGKPGSLQLWLEGCDVMENRTVESVNIARLIRVRGFGHIIGNLDMHNGNILVCGREAYAIDASRAFQDRSRLFHYLKHHRK